MQNAIDGGSGNGVVQLNSNQLAAIYFILSQVRLVPMAWSNADCSVAVFAVADYACRSSSIHSSSSFSRARLLILSIR